MTHSRIGVWVWAALLVALGCGDSDSGSEKEAVTGSEPDASADAAPDAMPDAMAEPAVEAADLEELLELGIDEFLGAAQPSGMETIEGVPDIADGSIVYDFDPEDGPVCLRGAPFNVSVLDQDSDNLVIFLQGGGACLSLICQATTEAAPRGVPLRGVLDSADPDNPVADWNMVYVPYCDGSVFGGDNDFEEADGNVRMHHGQRNFAAALDRALEHFPKPKKVLLAGSSAGGWGTVYHRALVRTQYPDAELTVLDDAGIGFGVNTPFVADEWGSTRFRPPSCDECQTSSHLTPFVRWDLEHDPSIVVGDFSSWEDAVIRAFTFTSDAAAFRMLLETETGATADAFPDRYKRFFIDGTQHTALLGGFHTTMVDGVSLAEWLGLMIDRDPEWQELLQ